MDGASLPPVGTGRPLVRRGLTKRFGPFTAVDGIDFEVRQGEAFGFLGPNGAGKSSTMRMVGCVSPLTAGTLRLFGLDAAKDGPRIRARLGVVPQQDSLDEELTLRENLIVYARYFDIPRAVAGRQGRGAARVRAAGRPAPTSGSSRCRAG